MPTTGPGPSRRICPPTSMIRRKAEVSLFDETTIVPPGVRPMVCSPGATAATVCGAYAAGTDPPQLDDGIGDRGAGRRVAHPPGHSRPLQIDVEGGRAADLQCGRIRAALGIEHRHGVASVVDAGDLVPAISVRRGARVA